MQQQLIAGRYRLGPIIGSGSSGVVHTARDLRLDRAVAIKLVATTQIGPHDLGGRQRFVREARAAAGFSHPNVVAVHDAGEEDGQLYLVMELVDGPTLAERLLTLGRFPVAEAVRIAIEMLDGLEAAHRAGVVHRDVKPANVLLSPTGQVKLADFGIARRPDDGSATLTGDGLLVGTVRYLAPEQLLGVAASPASDVYAVGVVLYELLTGRPPVDGDHAVAIVAAHHHGVVRDPHDERPGIPLAIAAVTMHALRPDPADRFPSADDMRAALARATAAAITIDVPDLPGASAPTERMTLPATSVFVPPPPPPRRRRSRSIPVLFVLVALAVIGGVAALASHDGSASVASETSTPAPTTASTAAASTTPATTVTATTSSPPETLAPTTAAPAPTDLAGLIAAVTGDPAAFGPHAEELGRRLRDVAARNGRKQSEAADRVLGDVAEWRSADQIDATAADQILAIVAPIAERHGD